MANYNLVIDSKFEPFSFERYLQPYQIYAEAYNKLADESSELEDNASVWEKLKNNPADAPTYSIYSDYMNELQENMESLYNEGLTPHSRKSFMESKKKYNNLVKPIEEAYKTREELIKEQREARQRDNSIIYDTDYSTVGLQDIIGTTPTYKSISIDDIEEETANIAETYAGILNDVTAGEVISTKDSHNYRKILHDYGFTAEDIDEVFNNPNSDSSLNAIRKAIYKKYKLDSWSPEVQIAANEAMRLGMSKAIGKDRVELKQEEKIKNEDFTKKDVEIGGKTKTFYYINGNWHLADDLGKQKNDKLPSNVYTIKDGTHAIRIGSELYPYDLNTKQVDLGNPIDINPEDEGNIFTTYDFSAAVSLDKHSGKYLKGDEFFTNIKNETLRRWNLSSSNDVNVKGLQHVKSENVDDDILPKLKEKWKKEGKEGFKDFKKKDFIYLEDVDNIGDNHLVILPKDNDFLVNYIYEYPEGGRKEALTKAIKEAYKAETGMDLNYNVAPNPDDETLDGLQNKNN